MKTTVWFLLGVIGGFAAAHLIDRTPAGHAAFARVNACADAFAGHAAAAYRAGRTPAAR